ncbi:RES family NAD+ phosphorylase [Specibacter cremeus]|uniref:RES family NAD+ phosphorylase n=1 Tax=Specibacter cremeus TaxID=1629051 RepID=UPI000F782F55|nr:RES family NAD+ phosphorylase [Specibacter cremeus]
MLRVSRAIDPAAFSWIGAVEARLAKQGNRFDVPGGGVLYAASDAATCFHEVCARFRPSPFAKALDFAEESHLMLPGNLPADWRDMRRIYSLEIDSSLPFVDIDNPQTWRWLEDRLLGDLARRSIDHLDADDVVGHDRALTRAMAAEIYTATSESGAPCYGGIRYRSRLNHGECWAIFEHVAVRIAAERTIERTDRDLVAWARQWDVTIH